MTIPEVLELARAFLSAALLIALPALAVSLIVGLIVSVFQTITSIQEQTLSFVPRLICVGLAMLLCLGWILQTAVHFTMQMITHAAEVVR
jgi:flagellar biosynthetic protein FliQ